MTARTLRRVLACLSVPVVALGLAAGCGGESSAEAPTSSGFRLTPLAATGTTDGAAYLSQDGDRLRGWIVVWGLAPGSRHASHLHANPEGEAAASCPDAQTDRHAVDFEPLVANDEGVAVHDVDIVVGEPVVRPGVYWMVHANEGHVHTAGSGAAPNPGLLCGDVVPDGAAS